MLDALKSITAAHLNLFHYLMGVENPEKRIAAQDFFAKKTFRMGPADVQSIGSLPKLFVQANLAMWRSKLNWTPVGEKIIFDSSTKVKELRVDYINKSRGQVLDFVSREQLGDVLSSADKVFLSFGMSFWFLFSHLALVKGISRKEALGMSYFELIEIAALLKIIRKCRVQIAHFFCPYEKDSNLIANVLIKMGVEVIKHPSTGPLTAHNKNLVATELAICSGYHSEECEQYLGQSIVVDKVSSWIPESAYTYFDLYRNKTLANEPNTVGFYSHGGWLRKKRGAHHAVFAKVEAEESLLEFLNERYAQSNITIEIYPHPMEMEEEVIEETTAFYGEKLAQLDFKLLESKTFESFHRNDLAYTTYSSILFERLFCGFKTIVYCEGLEAFPLPNTSMEKICAKTKEDLLNLSQHIDQMDTKAYFSAFALDKYIFFGTSEN